MSNVKRLLCVLSTALIALVAGVQTPAMADGAAYPSAGPSADSAGVRALVADTGPWKIFAKTIDYVDNQHCVDNHGNSQANGGFYDMWYCAGSTNQQFYMNNVTGSYWTIRNRFSNKCLTTAGHSSVSGSAIIQETCDNSTYQQFLLTKVVTTDFDYYFIKQRSSGKCLRLPNTSAQGTKLLLEVCDTDSDYYAYSSWTWWR